jgi:hypothetical protein
MITYGDLKKLQSNSAKENWRTICPLFKTNFFKSTCYLFQESTSITPTGNETGI